MGNGPWIRLILALMGSLCATAQWEEARGTDEALRNLTRAGQQHVAALRRGMPPPDPSVLIHALDRVEAEVTRDSQFKIDRFTKAVLDVEAHAQDVFGSIPRLPAENKTDDRWTFSPTRFDVVPQSLYVFGIKFKGSRTIRLRSVTLHFRDGTHVVHDIWTDREGGNGQAFRKRKYIPMLEAYGPDEVRQAKALSAVEVLGSAQDRHFTAQLDFVFRIPDPSARPFLPALEKIAAVKQSWDQLTGGAPQISADRIVADVRAIHAELGHPLPDFGESGDAPAGPPN